MNSTLQQPFSRNADLDVVKGMLVVVMLLYHSASVAEGSHYWQAIQWIPKRIAFIHFAFLIISGFLCGWHYLPKVEKEPGKVRQRLRKRGFKIIGLVIGLNFILYSLGVGHRLDALIKAIASPGGLMRNLVISVNGSLVSFEILYYIGLLLLAASMLLGRVNVWLLLGLTMGMLIVGPAKGVTMVVGLGLFGMVIGMMTIQGRFEDIWSMLENTRGIPVVIIFGLYQLLYNDIHYIMKYIGKLWIAYSIDALLWFLLFVFFFKLIPGSLNHFIRLLGRYTLFGYILQMLIIRIVYMFIRRFDIPGYAYYGISIVVSGMLLVLCTLTLERLRNRSHTINNAYRMVME
ncbi:MAG: hypothetical protein HZB31_09940 [Nitrospirae bacterium]|nr:hypothetical protein [Nitrospirota bacterium]